MPDVTAEWIVDRLHDGCALVFENDFGGDVFILDPSAGRKTRVNPKLFWGLRDSGTIRLVERAGVWDEVWGLK